MFGLLRFVLALLVIIGHTAQKTVSFHMHVSAVVVFYMISGYLMSIKFNSLKDISNKPYLIFCIDRILRVFPLYCSFAIITLIGVYGFGPSEHYLEFKFSRLNLLANLTLITNNFYPFTGTQLILPPTYSLALEEQFYLILPALLLFPKTIKPMLVLSLFVFGFGVVSPFLWGFDQYYFSNILVYRQLPGTFPMFMLGVFCNTRHFADYKVYKRIILAVYGVAFLWSNFTFFDKGGYLFAIYIGIFLGYFSVNYLKELPRTKVDDFLGNPSYGMFLCHFPVMWGLEKLSGLPRESVSFSLLTISVSIVLSYAAYYSLERPFNKFRYNVVKWLLS
jgi:peptidoglycan/LPS O-acetylase OafA/YrhL